MNTLIGIPIWLVVWGFIFVIVIAGMVASSVAHHVVRHTIDTSLLGLDELVAEVRRLVSELRHTRK